MKKVLLLAGLLMTAGMLTMAQEKPKKDTAAKHMHHMKGEPKKATDSTHHKKH
jgi:hypothetical protein